jgi:hypothetical protein
MLETMTFPVARCVRCARDVVAARDLDEAGQWVLFCTRCDGPLDGGGALRQVGSAALKGMGYTVDGDEEGGCGTGGCGSCGSGCG